MKLSALVSVISYVAVYASEQNGVTSIDHGPLLARWFHRQANPQVRIAANQANGAPPRLFLGIGDLRLFDNDRATAELSENVGSDWQGNARLDVRHKTGGSGFLRVHGDPYRNHRANMEPYFDFEAEKRLDKNDLAELRRKTADGDGVRSTFGGSANVGGGRFRRETDEIEDEINYRRRRDKIFFAVFRPC